MYIKLKNGLIDKYPYSVNELRQDNNNTSFPLNIPEERLSEWNVFLVSPTVQPDNVEGKELVEDTPVFDGEKWVQVWNLI
jgi:hypothetical protein